MEDFIKQVLGDVTELTSDQVNNLDSNIYNKFQNKIAEQINKKIIKNIDNLKTPVDPTLIDISWIGYINKNSKLYTLLLNHYRDEPTMKKYVKGYIETQTRILFVYEYTSNGNNILECLFNPNFKDTEG